PLPCLIFLVLVTLHVVMRRDCDPAAGRAAAAAVLWIGRRSFCVRHDPDTLRSAFRHVPLLGAAGLVLCWLAVSIAAPESASFVTILRETGDALLWQPGPLAFHDELG